MERKITIIGCGMGTRQGMTIEAAEALDAAGAVFGPARLTEALARAGQQAAVGYRSGELLSFLETVLEERIAVLVSGDSGFYSGAAMYLQALRDRKDIHVRICPGISSLSCLAARTGQSWEDAAIYSLHGRAQNYYASLCSGEKFVLLGGTGFSEVLGELCRSGFGSSRIWLGEQLGGAEEKILTGTAEKMMTAETGALSVLMVQPVGDGRILRRSGIEDDAFVRGKTPMTKSEVRAVSMSRLAVGRRDIVYDIGAGTGSVSVELSIAAAYGTVYAIERDAEALGILRQNRERFFGRNMQIVEGEAPEALADLPSPDKAFIGGSGGKMRQILELLKQKNPQIHVVVNAAALETLQETLAAMEALGYTGMETVQIAAVRTVQRGKYHMLEGLNPVYVITADGMRA